MLAGLAMLVAPVLLAGCAQTPPTPLAAERSGAVSSPQPSSPTESSGIITAASASAPLLTQAVELLNDGQVGPAETVLRQALQVDPKNKLAVSLLRQLTEDPQIRLGRDSTVYLLPKGVSLSQVAERFLGDAYLFPLLARYNDIKVPKNLAQGQALRIPTRPVLDGLVAPEVESGRARVEMPASPPEAVVPAKLEARPEPPAWLSAQAAEQAGNLDKALESYKIAAAQGHPTAAGKVDEMRTRLVARHARAARTALARQNLSVALQEWDKVLALKPGDETATLERRKVLRLREALQNK